MKKDIKIIMIICVIAVIVVALLVCGRIIVGGRTLWTYITGQEEMVKEEPLSKSDLNILSDKLTEKTIEFVSNCCNDNKISREDYLDFIDKIKELGLTPEITLEIEQLKEDAGKKSSFTAGDVKGENVYDIIEDEDIKNTLEKKDYKLKECDIFKMRVTTQYEGVTGDYAGIVQ